MYGPGETLHAGCRFGDPTELRQDVFFAEDQVLLVINLDGLAVGQSLGRTWNTRNKMHLAQSETCVGNLAQL